MKANLGILVILALFAAGVCIWCRPAFSNATATPAPFTAFARGEAHLAPAALEPTPPLKTPRENALDALRKEHLEMTGEDFVQTASQGNISSVALFLTAGMKVDERGPAERTALAAAALSGQLPVVKQLLDAGADIHARDVTGATPLMRAAQGGSVTTVEELLQRDAEIDAADAGGRTALLHAVAAGQVAAGKALLEKHADVSLRDAEGNDAFAIGIAHLGDTAFTRALLAAGPWQAAWTKASREILFRLIRLHDADGVSLYLKKHAAQPTLGEGQQTLLAYSVAWADADQLRLLLDGGADPNTPLSIPAEKEFVQCFKGKLLPHYLTEEKGMTPLMVAAGMGRADLVQMLVEHGARPGATTARYKIAPLIFAAWAKDVSSQLILLGRKPRIEEQPMRVRVSLRDQRAYVYQGGNVTLTTPISSGREGFDTPTGQFVVSDKQIKRMSSLYKVPMPYFIRLSCSDVGMHAGVVPGYPASHGCIRMPADKAQRLYHEIEIGTPVTITN